LTSDSTHAAPARRTELAAFLRMQRARLTPADAGLIEGSASPQGGRGEDEAAVGVGPAGAGREVETGLPGQQAHEPRLIHARFRHARQLAQRVALPQAAGVGQALPQRDRDGQQQLGRCLRTSSSTDSMPSRCSSSSRHAAVNCLLADAMSKIVPAPIGTSCSITAQPAAACAPSAPSR
jgi:hypothetical protein